MAYPEWVERQPRPRCNISCTRGKYYLYEVTSVYDREKKRARKITTGYLGRITEEGLIPPRKKPAVNRVPVREYGAAAALLQLGGGVLARLRQAMPAEADGLFALAALRLAHPVPLSLCGAALKQSWLAETFPGVRAGGAALRRLLAAAGENARGRAAFEAGNVPAGIVRGRKKSALSVSAGFAGPGSPAPAVLAALFAQDAEGLDGPALEGLLFLNRLTGRLGETLEERLRQAGLPDTPAEELLLRLSGIYRVKIAGAWVESEIPAGTKRLLDRLGLEIGGEGNKP